MSKGTNNFSENQVGNLIDKLLPGDGILPNDEAVEKSLIGILINYPNESIDQVVGKLYEADFYNGHYGKIFSAITSLYVCDISVNVITLADELSKRGQLDIIGGRYALTGFPIENFSLHYLKSYLNIVLEKSKKRRRWKAAARIARSVLNGVDETEFSIYLSELIDTQRDSLDDDRFKIHWAAEALEEQPDIEWIVKPVFVAPGVSVFHGPHGSKKTYAMLDAAISISCGESWLGFETQQLTTLFIDEESGEKRLKRRLAEILRGHEVDCEIPFAFNCLPQFDFRKADDAAVLSRIIKKIDAKFVVIDAMVDVMPGADENSSKDLIPLFLNVRRVANETDSHIVLLHHDNRLGDYRGSSAIPAAIDAMFQVRSEKRSGIIEFIGKKTRDVDEFDFFSEICFDAGKVYLRKSDAPAERFGLELRDRILRILAEGSMNTSSLLNTVGGRRENTYRALDVLEKSKQVKKENGKHGAIIYSRTV
jgi:hypothetical protein